MTSSEHLTPCPDSARAHHPQADTVHGFSVDADLKPVLESLWEDGINTLCSCQGDTNVRHSVVGRVHNHEGFISVLSFTDATRTFTWLEEREANPFLSVEPDGHNGAREYVVNFDPVTTWGRGPDTSRHQSAASLRDGAVRCVRALPTVLVFILAVLGAAVVFGVLLQRL